MSKKVVQNITPEKTAMGVFVALDLGATEIRAIAAKKDQNGKFHYLASATYASKSIFRGYINNIEIAKNDIKHVITDLENTIKVLCNNDITDPYEKINVKIEQVYVALNGQSIRTTINRVSRRLGGSLITQELLDQFDTENRNVLSTSDLEIVDITPIQYLVDDEENPSPVGCRCEVIQATYNIILGKRILLSNLRDCLAGIGIKLAGYCVSPIAASNATISANEKELGIVMVDFGDSTTNLAVYYKGKLHYSLVVPIGSSLITNDISELRIVKEDAEKIKKKGNCHVDKTKQDIIIGLSNNKDISYHLICDVIERRIDQILDYVKLGIQESKLAIGPQLDQIVLLGKASELKGLANKIEEKIGLAAHKGKLLEQYSHLVKNGTPLDFAVAIGTLITAKENCAFSVKMNERPKEKRSLFRSFTTFTTSLFSDDIPENQTNNKK